MHRILMFLVLLIIFTSCKSKFQSDSNLVSKILEANHINNSDFNTVYKSLDSTLTTFIIDKKAINKSEFKSILDTLKIQNYFVKINSQTRTIEFVRK